MTKNVRFEDQNNNWEIWKKNSSIERSTKRVVGKLPEMEATKQLVKILKKFIDLNIPYWILDVPQDIT